MTGFVNLGDLIRRDRDLEKIAIVDLGGEQSPREFSFAQLDAMANGVARALLRRGLQHGDRVAILSAMETVNVKVPSTVEAAALCKMSDRRQIEGGILDGPLALDNAISPEAAAIKNIASPVAGRANVLVVPDLEAGNMLAKSLSFLAGADAAGIVLGARVPIILTSRADSVVARLASCAASQPSPIVKAPTMSLSICSCAGSGASVKPATIPGRLGSA